MPGSRFCAFEPLLYMCGTDYIKRRYKPEMPLIYHRGLDDPVDRRTVLRLDLLGVGFCCISVPSKNMTPIGGIPAS